MPTTTIRIFAALSLFLACSEPCEKESASDAPVADEGDPEAKGEACCFTPSTPELAADLCETHPFGRAIGCGGIEEPQTIENCQNVLRLNDDICTSDYIDCREAIRKASCDVCPPECDGIEGAC